MRRKRLTNFSVQASSQRRLPSLYRLVKKNNYVEPSLPRDRDRNLHSFVRSKEITVYIFHCPNIFSVKIIKAEEQKYYQITKR